MPKSMILVEQWDFTANKKGENTIAKQLPRPHNNITIVGYAKTKYLGRSGDFSHLQFLLLLMKTLKRAD